MTLAIDDLVLNDRGDHFLLQVVTQQFNSPLNLYSDETIVDTVIANRGVGGGVR